MVTTERALRHFEASADTLSQAGAACAKTTTLVASLIVECLLNGGKILACGNGGSAATAHHFCGKLVNRFEQERPGLPALALAADESVLTALADDGGYHTIFSKQVRTFGQAGDILLVISAGGHSANLVNAIDAAHDRDIKVVALTGQINEELGQQLTEEDLEIKIPSSKISRVQEVHLVVIHCLCDLIDHQIFGG